MSDDMLMEEDVDEELGDDPEDVENDDPDEEDMI